MPTYCYTCSGCGESFEIVAPMSESSKPRKCVCGKDAVRSLQLEHAQGNVDGLQRDNPRWSWALGINPNQIKEAMKKHPGAVFNEKGQMLIRNRQEKKQRMREAGMIEFN